MVVYEFWIDCHTWDGRTPRGSTVTIFYSKGVAEKNQKIKTGHSVRFKRQAAERFGHISNGIRCTKVQGEDSSRFWAFYNRSFKFHRWVHCFQKEFQRGVWRLHLASKLVILLKKGKSNYPETLQITWKRANENVHASLVRRVHISRIYFARLLFEEKWTISYSVCPTYSFIIGLPVAPNYGLGFLRRKKKQKNKKADRSPRGRYVSHFNGADFFGEGTGISGRCLTNRFGSRFGTSTKLFRGVIGPISTPNDYLNAVFDDIISLCGSCRNNALPQSPREKLQLVAILLPACDRSFLTIKEYAICRSPHQTGTYSLAMDS